jgi:hypothetical protein
MAFVTEPVAEQRPFYLWSPSFDTYLLYLQCMYIYIYMNWGVCMPGAPLWASDDLRGNHFWFLKSIEFPSFGWWKLSDITNQKSSPCLLIKSIELPILWLIHEIHWFFLGKSSTPKHGPLSVAQKLAQATNAKSDATNRPGTRWSNHNLGMFLTSHLW